MFSVCIELIRIVEPIKILNICPKSCNCNIAKYFFYKNLKNLDLKGHKDPRRYIK